MPDSNRRRGGAGFDRVTVIVTVLALLASRPGQCGEKNSALVGFAKKLRVQIVAPLTLRLVGLHLPRVCAGIGIATYAARHGAAATGAPAAAKADSFTITVSDGHGGTTGIPIDLTVIAANAVPVANGRTGQTNSTTEVITGTINVADTDGDILAYSGCFASSKGTCVHSCSVGDSSKSSAHQAVSSPPSDSLQSSVLPSSSAPASPKC